MIAGIDVVEWWMLLIVMTAAAMVIVVLQLVVTVQQMAVAVVATRTMVLVSMTTTMVKTSKDAEDNASGYATATAVFGNCEGNNADDDGYTWQWQLQLW